MSDVARVRMVHYGPDFTFTNPQPIYLGFYVLLACLRELEPQAFDLVFQRFSKGMKIQITHLPSAAPWTVFNKVSQMFVEGLSHEIRTRSGIGWGSDTNLMLYGNFRQTAEAILALTVLEKAIRHPKLELKEVRKLCFDEHRVENILGLVDDLGQEPLKEGIRQELLQQAEVLQNLFPDLWEDLIADDWQALDTSSVATIHDQLCEACNVVHYESAGLKRLIASGMEPVAVIQEESSLLTATMVGLYHAYPYNDVRNAMVKAEQQVQGDFAKTMAHHAQPGQPPPKPAGKLYVVK